MYLEYELLHAFMLMLCKLLVPVDPKGPKKTAEVNYCLDFISDGEKTTKCGKKKERNKVMGCVVPCCVWSYRVCKEPY